MKRYGIFVLLCCFTFSIATVATSQIYFEDNFDNANKSEKKWVPLWGQWEFKDKEYHLVSECPIKKNVVARQAELLPDWNATSITEHLVALKSHLIERIRK